MKVKKIPGSFTKEQLKYLEELKGKNKTDKLKLNQNMGRDQFLRILTTQLSHQNPLEPLKDKDFIAQMAQFSSVEAMQSLNKSFDTVKSDISSIKTLIKEGATKEDAKKQSDLLDKIGKTLDEIKASQLKMLKDKISENKSKDAYK